MALGLVRGQDVAEVVGEAGDLELEILWEGNGEQAGTLQGVLEERDWLAVGVASVDGSVEHGHDVVDVTCRGRPTIHGDSGSPWYEHRPAPR
jgi:hypothetical protein